MRVPLIFWWPGRIPEGNVISRPAQSVDVLPTLLELSSISPPAGLAGRSWAAEVLASRPLPTSSESEPPVLVQLDASRWALTAERDGGRYKYVVQRDAPPQLFDLATDPGERRDLVDRRPKIAQALRALAREVGVSAASSSATRSEPVPEAIREQLRAIGYVEEADAAP